MTLWQLQQLQGRASRVEGQAHGRSGTCRVRPTSTDWCSGAPASLMALSWLTAKPALSNSFLSISKLASCVLVLMILNFRACSSQVQQVQIGRQADERGSNARAVLLVACLQQPGSLAWALVDLKCRRVLWCDVMA